MASYNAVSNLPDLMVEAYEELMIATGLQGRGFDFVIDHSEHGAYTNRKQIVFGPSWVDAMIHENYHGYTDPTILMGSSTFVIAHEIGHLTVQPYHTTSWSQELKEWPVNASVRGKWANYHSDILVNTHLAFARDWESPPSTPKEKEIADYNEYGMRWYLASRDCGETAAHQILLDGGTDAWGNPVVDNRYQAPGGIIGQYEISDPSDRYKPILGSTPLWQTRQGHGRGHQYYPSLAYSCANNLPVNFRTVKNSQDREIGTCNSCDEVQVNMNSGRCVKCSTPLGSLWTLSAGEYEVTATESLEGIVNDEMPNFPHYVIINGKKVPFAVVTELCPMCKESAGTQITRSFQPEEVPVGVVLSDGELQWNSLLRIKLQQEFAGWAALKNGYKGLSGKAAGYKFLEDVAISMHYPEWANGRMG